LGDDDFWTWEADTDPDDLRNNEKHYAVDGDFASIFDLRSRTKLEAGLNIAKTIFVCIVLTMAAIIFTRDANRLVLIPIERMMDKVKRIAKNPLEQGDEDPGDFYKYEA
jgi:hypothetical protein